MNNIFIPIGIDCSVAHYLRKNNKRLVALPFDWNLIPVSSAIRLIQNGFSDFMEEENMIFLPPTNRLLFEENGIDLKQSKEIITPALDKKYKILFPHDFTDKGKRDLDLVKGKYDRRVTRLKQILDKSEKVTFVYNLREPNEWQSDQYKLSGCTFPLEGKNDIHKKFDILQEDLKINKVHSELISLDILKLYELGLRKKIWPFTKNIYLRFKNALKIDTN